MLALRKTGRAGRIVVIGPPEVLAEAQRVGVEGLLPEGDSGPENVLRGLRWLSEARELERIALEMASTVVQEEERGFRVLIVATDLPFLTAEALERFLDACPPDAELAVPVITQQEFDARYPNSGSTYTPLKDGNFTTGGTFLADVATILRNEAHLRALFAARKSPWKMARLIGFSTILRYLTRQLTVAQLVEQGGKIARCNGVAIPQMPPELDYDIDELYEFDYARSWQN